jgi:hypothetical protein
MLRCFATQSLEASGGVLKISRFAGDRSSEISHFINSGLPVRSHVGIALFQAEIGMANGFTQGLGAVREDKGFSEMLVSVVCHVSLLFVCANSYQRIKIDPLESALVDVCVECTVQPEWGLNFTSV